MTWEETSNRPHRERSQRAIKADGRLRASTAVVQFHVTQEHTSGICSPIGETHPSYSSSTFEQAVYHTPS